MQLHPGTIYCNQCYYHVSNMILYDGDCALCNSQVRFIRGRDRQKQFLFVPLQSEEGRSMLRSAGLSEDELDTVVYVRDDKYLLRSSAVLGILGDLGGAWRLLTGLRVVPSRLRDFIYSLIAKSRHRLAPRRRR